MPGLLLLVLGMLEVLVVLVVFVGGIFEKVKSPNIFIDNYRIQKENVWSKK